MTEHWIALTDLPAHGREFSFADQEIWQETWRSFGMDFAAHTPLEAVFTVTPQKDGFLIRGRLRGAVRAICDRCAEEAVLTIDHAFDEFEAIADIHEDDGEESHLRPLDAGFALDAAGMLWEQFVLALPAQVLCSDSCQGLCPMCGVNKNHESCQCSKETPLARALAARGFSTPK
ncbi:MAG: hypothetical protein JG774_322 [Desulfomicrobiaceae bacterium]|jgi:uncharacterized protein|nr:DUF177 domain-containing protein [Desulfomicrobiaceae bacterium]MBZ4647996.1 hypothetical protein [Desulfomicrobiaceae bacterium]MBZ4684577.1 hypothetical protein [Desulfomicrobiaceae bacterium]MDI3493192.1 hypothetical protein [Desulfomicrobiaceae bacterium]MDK2872735.1 hypothetical protein [Desulfomicrobiaceae bacterium]